MKINDAKKNTSIKIAKQKLKEYFTPMDYFNLKKIKNFYEKN